jgi:hypothetical protein
MLVFKQLFTFFKMCCSMVYTFQMQMCIELRRKKPFNGLDFEIKLKEVEDRKVF